MLFSPLKTRRHNGATTYFEFEYAFNEVRGEVGHDKPINWSLSNPLKWGGGADVTVPEKSGKLSQE